MYISDFPALNMPFRAEVACGTAMISPHPGFHPRLRKPPQPSAFTSPEMRAEAFKLIKDSSVTFSSSSTLGVCHS